MDNKITFFPTPLPDEHILSTIARWQKLQNGRVTQKTLPALSFENAALNPFYFFRKLYRDIFEVYRGELPLKDFFKHTLYNYYSPFNTRNLVTEFFKSDIDIISLRHQQSLKTAGHWRWCHDCTIEDVENYGTTFWHNAHQMPSLLHCHIHNKRLISMCECGFVSSGFQKLSLPPKNNRCPSCNKTFDSTPKSTPLTTSLDKISIKLMNSLGGNKTSSIKNALLERAGIDPGVTGLREHRRITVRIQKRFNTFAEENSIANIYFSEKKGQIRTNQSLIQISEIMTFQKIFPPLFYLIFMKFFIENDEDIERILFEGGCGHE